MTSVCSFKHFYYYSLVAMHNQALFALESEMYEECAALWAEVCASLANWAAKLIGCTAIIYLVPSNIDKWHARWNSCDKILGGTLFYDKFFFKILQSFYLTLP